MVDFKASQSQSSVAWPKQMKCGEEDMEDYLSKFVQEKKETASKKNRTTRGKRKERGGGCITERQCEVSLRM